MRAWMKRHKILTGMLLVFLLCFITARAAWYYHERMYFIGLLPDPLEITSVIKTASRFGYCGGGVYTLSPTITAKIQDAGLAFFQNISVSRNHLTEPNRAFENWQPTPLPKDMWHEGSLFFCFGPNNLGKSLDKKLIEAAKTPGSYYASYSGIGKILVFPSLNIVVLDYFYN